VRLLLDTHALLWFCQGSDALSDVARAAIEDETNERFVSHATAWEIAIKLGLGKLQLGGGYESIFPGVLDANGFVLLPPTLAHYLELVPLPRHHGDPFDRLIIAQARVEGLTVVTCDAEFAAYGVPVLW
jgi:PIN domain nuclease of toxin-antitoxin system